MSKSVTPRGLLYGTLGGLIGGAAGYFTFVLLLRFGRYGMMIPGAAVGLGVGRMSGERSTTHGILAAVLGLGAGLVAQWRNFLPADDSLLEFLSNIGALSTIAKVMIVVGAAFAFWFGQGRERFTKRDATPSSAPEGNA